MDKIRICKRIASSGPQVFNVTIQGITIECINILKNRMSTGEEVLASKLWVGWGWYGPSCMREGV